MPSAQYVVESQGVRLVLKPSCEQVLMLCPWHVDESGTQTCAAHAPLRQVWVLLHGVPPARYPDPLALQVVATEPLQTAWSGSQTPTLQLAVAASQYSPVVHVFCSFDERPSAAQVRTVLPVQNETPGSHALLGLGPGWSLAPASDFVPPIAVLPPPPAGMPLVPPTPSPPPLGFS